MSEMHIVTGYRGENHVTAADIGSFNAAIFGTGEFVLDRGSKFETTVVSNNLVRVADGDLLIQGRHVRLNEDTYIDLSIENGAQGYLRNDLIVARYEKDSNTGVESVNLVVIKGTSVASNPVDPAYTKGDIINDHVYLADMPLYRVPLNGLNVQALVPLFEIASLQKPHASTHAKGGSDEITPAAIGAIPTTQKATASGIASLDSNSKVTASQASSAIVAKTASYTLALSDAGKMITMNSTSATTLTVPANASVAFPTGTEIEVARLGTGAVTIAGASGVTINSIDSVKTIAARYGCVCLKKTGTNVWLLGGALG